jgi:tryptophan-rich sensory protein
MLISATTRADLFAVAVSVAIVHSVAHRGAHLLVPLAIWAAVAITAVTLARLCAREFVE